MLFQPTNITPSILGETGNGVVDITQDLNVSWQVNGNSPMTAFTIGIYLNDTNSTPVYNTGRRVDNCPFYGTDYKGNTQIFSATIQAANLMGARSTAFYSASGGITAVTTNYTTFATAVEGNGNYTFRFDGTGWYYGGNAITISQYGITVTGTPATGDTITVAYGMVNGETYKLIITQYWGVDDSVTQIAASAFKTRSLPVVTLDEIPNPLTTRARTFTARYSQDQGDTISWVRWRIALASDLDNPIYDTQNIYGTSQLRVDYEGFFTGNTYAVSCTVQTENGVEMSSGWTEFAVEYSMASLAGSLTVCRSKKASAVVVQWPQVTYVPGAATGEYSVAGGNLSLAAGSSVLWNTVNGTAMGFDAKWSLAFDTRLSGSPISLFAVSTDEGMLTVSYTTPTLTVTMDGETLYTKTLLPRNSRIAMIITPDMIYLRYKYDSGGLEPKTTLYPATDLYPSENVSTTENTESKRVQYNQGKIISITAEGEQRCNYVWIEKGTMSDGTIQSILYGDEFEPVYGDDSYLMANFNDDLQGGSLAQYSGSLTGLALYRQEGDNQNLEYLATMPLSTRAIMDYSVKSQTAYMYYLFPSSDTVYVTDAVMSESITPVFWKWTILECDLQDDGHYLIYREYDFANNVSSGEMSNNNVPTIFTNFTPYPIVQPSPNLYRSGTLSGYIGTVDYINGNGYSDTIEQRDALFALGQTRKTLFLKNRKGDLFEIRISGAVTANTADDTREQIQQVSLSWVEVADASGAVIIGEYTGEAIIAPTPTPEPSGDDCITYVDAVPTEKLTTMIFNTTTGAYYLWRN